MSGDINVLYERAFKFLPALRNADGKANPGGMHSLLRLGPYPTLRTTILALSFKCNMSSNVKMYEDCCGGPDCNFISPGVKTRYPSFQQPCVAGQKKS